MFKINYLSSYIKATENEIATDGFLIKSIKHSVPALPRISKWINISNHPFILYIAYLALFFLFIIGGFLLYTLFFTMLCFCQRVKFAFGKRWRASKCAELIYYFYFSELGFSQVVAYFKSKSVTTNNKLVTIQLPWLKVKNKSDTKVVSLFEFLSYTDLLKMFALCIITFGCYLMSPSRIKWILQIYTAPKWYLVAFAMNKIPGKIISSEHYDRWATLVDIICDSKGVDYTIVQHGSLKALGSKTYADFNIPYRLKSVGSIIVFDEVEWSFFNSHIFDAEILAGINVEYFNPTLNISPVRNEGECSLLFVGHSLCEDVHIAMCASLRSSLEGVNIYYKEHPKAKASTRARNNAWFFISDEDFFPDVDIVISYPSTLAHQYEGLGKVVLFHELNAIDKKDIDIIIKTVINYKEAYDEPRL